MCFFVFFKFLLKLFRERIRVQKKRLINCWLPPAEASVLSGLFPSVLKKIKILVHMAQFVSSK